MAPNDLTTFVCLFHHPDYAEDALNALVSAGFHRSAITSTWSGTQGVGAGDLDGELRRIGVPDRDLAHMQEGIGRGGVVLSLEAPESRSREIETIFERYSAARIDEDDIDRGQIAAEPFVQAGNRGGTREAESAVVPIVAEELTVTKRPVDQGGVRVFQRVVEEPVSASLQLEEQHVVVERRPVDRAVTQADMRGDREIELVETEEIPVVSKVARVVEEVRLGVVGSEHTERIEETVRHTEVRMESVPTDATTAPAERTRDERAGR